MVMLIRKHRCKAQRTHDQILVLQLWPMAGIDGYGSDPGNDADDDDDILNAIRAVPLSMPASLRRVLPWHPVGEPQDPCLRHMSVGVASALRQLMIHEAAHDWFPPILDEATCVLLRV